MNRLPSPYQHGSRPGPQTRFISPQIRGLRPRMRGAVAILVITVATTAPLAVSWAASRSTGQATTLSHRRVLSYPLKHVWPAALRYLRVDRGYAIVDRDDEAGYILFEFSIERPSAPVPDDQDELRGQGSLEMMATVDASGRPSVQIKISTDRGPLHLPHAIAEGLASKLREERGMPAPPPRPDPPSPPKTPDSEPTPGELEPT